MTTGDYLSAHATEGSTYVVTAAFYDENGDPVTPTAITWTLVDEAGLVINSRSGVEIDPPDQSVEIVLQGADLPGPGNVLLAINATYNSTLGSNLPLKEQVRIRVDAVVP